MHGKLQCSPFPGDWTNRSNSRALMDRCHQLLRCERHKVEHSFEARLFYVDHMALRECENNCNCDGPTTAELAAAARARHEAAEKIARHDAVGSGPGKEQQRIQHWLVGKNTPCHCERCQTRGCHSCQAKASSADDNATRKLHTAIA